MARYRRRDSIEAHLAEAVEAGGRSFSAELIAKRATGVSGYKMTLGFFELEGSDAYLVELDPASGSLSYLEFFCDEGQLPGRRWRAGPRSCKPTRHSCSGCWRLSWPRVTECGLADARAVR